MPEAPFVLSPPNAYDDKSDEELVRMAADGDREAFGALYRRYVRQIYSYILYRVQNVQEAEDLTARTFFRALQNIHRFEYRGLAFSAYLYRIAHNLVSNWHRDHGRARTIPLEEAPVVRPARKLFDDNAINLAFIRTHIAVDNGMLLDPGDFDFHGFLLVGGLGAPTKIGPELSRNSHGTGDSLHGKRGMV